MWGALSRRFLFPLALVALGEAESESKKAARGRPFEFQLFSLIS